MALKLERMAPETRDFAAVVEELLARRRSQARASTTNGGDELWPKVWTREELCDVAYSSYKALLKGAIRRPPRREVVMEVADYLACSLVERNRLLAAARYALEQPYLAGTQLEAALAVAQQVIDELPLPAHSLTRDWSVHLVNRGLLRLLGLGAEQLPALPDQPLNVLELVFDPRLPLHSLLSPNPETWERTARREVYGFKLQNALCQYDEWYAQRVARLMELPRFAEFWNAIGIDTSPASLSDHESFQTYVFEFTYPDGSVLRIRSLLIALGDVEYPKVVAYVPLDDTTRRVYRELGLGSSSY